MRMLQDMAVEIAQEPAGTCAMSWAGYFQGLEAFRLGLWWRYGALYRRTWRAS